MLQSYWKQTKIIKMFRSSSKEIHKNFIEAFNFSNMLPYRLNTQYLLSL